mmetsp:Transcript_98368/g.219671  ORF Transcript_98368/g.219671 Transcript_98368/m.219671 type:complete len:97 (-) Transcript_98368:785-1075(-)
MIPHHFSLSAIELRNTEAGELDLRSRWDCTQDFESISRRPNQATAAARSAGGGTIYKLHCEVIALNRDHIPLDRFSLALATEEADPGAAWAPGNVH